MDRDVWKYGAHAVSNRKVYALVNDMAVAERIVKYAVLLHVTARNFDRAQALIDNARKEKPFLVILDFEKCEAEAFQTLKELHESADLKGVPVIGFATQAKVMVKPEAEKAGCFRVYMKTEFGKELPDLIARYAI